MRNQKTTQEHINKIIEFRQALYAHGLGRRKDALFEALDALCMSGPVDAFPRLSLNPVHRRQWHSLYKAVEQGSLDAWSDAELDLSVSTKDLSPLKALTKSDIPPIGPVSVTTRLSLGEEGYLLDDLRVQAGSKGAVWAAAKAKLGPLRYDDADFFRFLSADVVMEWTSAAALGRLLNKDIPDIGPGTGRFRIEGRPRSARRPRCR